MVAHSHIDAAWLWTLEETVKVCKDSFEKVLDLLEKHKGVVYVQSSALYYKWMEEKYPSLFQRIKRAVLDGKWHLALPFVETDAYMPSGEALIRQIVTARRYFREKFGVEPKTVFLPDTFGFTNALPSLAKLSGAEYFITHKLNWNDAIEFPYRLFWWRGPDGNKLLAHILMGSYSGFPGEDRIREEIEKMKSFQGLEITYIFYGYGDHGGGISEEMADMADKLYEKGVAEPAGPDEFFRYVEEELADRLPEYEGELYLQYHRGVFTTQARFKRNYAKTERILLLAESLSTIAWMLGSSYEDLSEAWEKLLLLDFHDIIAGSSIPEVYDEAERVLASVRDRAVASLSKSLQFLLKLQGLNRGELIAFNPLPWAREAVILERGSVMFSGKLDSYRGTALQRNPEKYKVVIDEVGHRVRVSNRHLTAVFDKKTGSLIGLSNGNMNAIDDGRGGVHIQVLVDEPKPGRRTVWQSLDATIFDAWEVFYTHYPEGVKMERLLNPETFSVRRLGPEAVIVSAKYRYRQAGRPDSVFTLRYIVDGASKWVSLEIEADWKASHRIAKLYIPFREAVDEIYFEQPYGWVQRVVPGSEKASLFDKAMWEAPLQRWVYVPGESVGLVILNESTYGCDYGSRYLRLSLLRAAEYPKPFTGESKAYLTDQGEHVFRIGIMPVNGKTSFSRIQRAAMEFVHPPLVWRLEEEKEKSEKGYFSFELAGEPILTAMLPQAKNSVLVRVYNPDPASQEFSIEFPVKILAAYKTTHDGEKILESLTVSENTVKGVLKPREVATLRIAFGRKK